jgi:hypothetical protein
MTRKEFESLNESHGIRWQEGDHNQKFLRRFKDGAELWSFVNGGGAPYCAIFYNGVEEYSYPLAGMKGMVEQYEKYRVPRHLKKQKKDAEELWESL